MTDHDHIQLLISAYIDQELSESDRQAVEDHLVDCEECQCFYRDARNISVALKAWAPGSLSPDMEQKMAKRIRAQQSREGERMRKLDRLIPYNAMSTFIICLLVLTVSLRVYLKRNVQTVLQGARDQGGITDIAVHEAHKTEEAAVKEQPLGSEGVSLESEAVPAVQTQTDRLSHKGEIRQAVMGLSGKAQPEERTAEIPARSLQKGTPDARMSFKGQAKPVEVSRTPDISGLTGTKSIEFQKTAVPAQIYAGSAKAERPAYGRAEKNGGQVLDSLAQVRSYDAGESRLRRSVTADESAVFQGGPGAVSPAVEDDYADGYAGEIYNYTDKGLTPMRPGLMIVKPDQEWEEPYQTYPQYGGGEAGNTEAYDRIYENEFLSVPENPLSTFSIDVDTASYANIRRYLDNGQLPPKDAVRIEEMLNYFVYDYPPPDEETPFSVTTETSVCPWNPDHQLTLIGIKARELSGSEMPPSNLVFLIDVSGSMNKPEKLPLLKSALRTMVQRLRPEEKISIVTYAGQAGLLLDSTPGYEKERILTAIDRLTAGGSTAGEQGIQLAYRIARQNFIPQGNNRVVLATDGDFNVGISSDGELTRIIEAKRAEGIFLTVLGFGTGNYKDAKMEKLADKGDGNYYYIDTLREARKVLGAELGSMLFPVAKDVKIQVEFNPAAVKAYRLIGYENRALAKEDFNDDSKDAGELGAGHTVTAFYEIVPADSREEHRKTDPLKYTQTFIVESGELMTVKLRYKELQQSTSRLLTRVVQADQIEEPAEVSDNFRFGSAVAEFGLLLRDSAYKGQASYRDVLQRAKASLNHDAWGYRSEFLRLVEKAAVLSREY